MPSNDTNRTSKAFSEEAGKAIGVFDSGIGGLTVVRELMDLMPYEKIIYFGDTARLPYGTKSEDVVKRFALEDSYFLLSHRVKMIVVACNTVSATALPLLKRHLPVPVIGVIDAAVKRAIEVTRNGRIGVIGTATTIRSDRYRQELLKRKSNLIVIQQACPLFVPLVEEGLIDDEATYLIARRYLTSLIGNEVDTLILGCTHYPLLKSTLQNIMGPEVVLVDSGEEAAKEVRQVLEELGLQNPSRRRPDHRFYVSDLPFKFQEIAERFLRKSLPHIEFIDFDQFLVSKGKNFQKVIEELLLTEV